MLYRIYVSHENVSGTFFLYLAWERTNVLGSANMDFEFNQATQTLSDSSVGPVTINRTAGDILITFDFTNGGGTPVLGLLRWVTSGPASQCFSANSVPCWGNRVDLSAAGFADGAVNAGTVIDPIPPNAPRSLPGLTFGEAAINLTAANVFPPGQCVNFASAFLKSRSSASFTAEVKDFIAPSTANITNCGTVKIHKQDDLGAPLAGAVFTLFTDNTPIDGPPPHGAEDTATSFTCTTDASGNCSIASVPFGNYWAVETTGVPNHDPAPDQSFTLSAANDTITLTFVDPRSKGAILVTKTAKNKAAGGSAPLPGATFELRLSGSNTVLSTKVTDANGHVCFDGTDGVIVGSMYTVTESAAPANYVKDATPSKSVSVTQPADCASNIGNAAQVAFSNLPLSKITVQFASNAGPGVTTATIQCTGDASASPLPEGAPGRVLDNLVPGTYSCTVIIDP